MGKEEKRLSLKIEKGAMIELKSVAYGGEERRKRLFFRRKKLIPENKGGRKRSALLWSRRQMGRFSTRFGEKPVRSFF